MSKENFTNAYDKYITTIDQEIDEVKAMTKFKNLAGRFKFLPNLQSSTIPLLKKPEYAEFLSNELFFKKTGKLIHRGTRDGFAKESFPGTKS